MQIRSRLIGFGLFATVTTGAWLGFQVGDKPLPDFTADVWFKLKNIGIIHPEILYVLVGFGVGFYLIPVIREFFIKKKNTEAAYDELRAAKMGDDKQVFFTHLGKALGRWRFTSANLNDKIPNDINRFIDLAPYPDWLLADDLYSEATTRLKDPDPFWSFTLALYQEVYRYLYKQVPPTLLIEEEIRSLHEARRRISYFWGEIGRKIFITRSIRYRDVVGWLDNDPRVLKFVAYLDVALHVSIISHGRGSNDLYRLGTKYFRVEPNPKWQEWVRTKWRKVVASVSR